MFLKVANGSNNHMPKVPKCPLEGFGFILISLKRALSSLSSYFRRECQKLKTPQGTHGDFWHILVYNYWVPLDRFLAFRFQFHTPGRFLGVK